MKASQEVGTAPAKMRGWDLHSQVAFSRAGPGWGRRFRSGGWEERSDKQSVSGCAGSLLSSFRAQTSSWKQPRPTECR